MPDQDPTLLGSYTRTEVAAIAAQAVAVLPVGATEQHGPHLPIGTDALIVEHLARQAARLVAGPGPVVVAPTLSYGSSHHHLPYGATISISTATYLALVSDLVDSLVESGFRRIFVLNGHGGNAELVSLVARDVSARRKVVVAAASYWQLAAETLREGDGGPSGEIPGHAGEFETSMIMALYPQWVAAERPDGASSAPPGPGKYRFGSPHPFRSPTGFSDSPLSASADRGRDFLATCIEAVAATLQDFDQRSRAELGQSAPADELLPR
jgi:creatinine amidohydrolase